MTDTITEDPVRLAATLEAETLERAVLTRQGIDWRYRATRNSILFRPMFGPHFGWQPKCGRYGCQDVMFERTDYRELEPAADRDDRDARLAFLAVRREQIHELWGRP